VGCGGCDESIGFAVNDESRSRYLRDAAVGFPANNPLKLTCISLRGGKPLHADSHILVDALARGGSVIDERDDGLLGFFRSEVAAHKSLQRGRFGLHGMGTARRGAAKNQRAHAARILKRKFLRNHASHGDAEDVRTLHASSIHSGGRIRSHQCDGIDAWRDIALAYTTIIESDGAITVGENRAAAMPHVGGIAEANDRQKGSHAPWL